MHRNTGGTDSQEAIDAYLARFRRAQSSSAVELSVSGMDLRVDTNVFKPDPDVTWSTAQILDALPPATGARVLDVGSGTGVLGLACAARGAAEVVCVDIAPAAVRNARSNARRLGVEERLCVLEGDVSSGQRFVDLVDGRRSFDLVLANLPIYVSSNVSGSPGRACDVTQVQLISLLPGLLKPGGTALVSYANFGRHREAIEDACAQSGLEVAITETIRYGVRWWLFRLCRQRRNHLRLC